MFVGRKTSFSEPPHNEIVSLKKEVINFKFFCLETTGPILKVLSDKKLSDVRNVIKDQNLRIARLERQITQMRQRREWGDASTTEDSQSKHSRTSSGSSSVSTSSSESSNSDSTSQASRMSGSDKSVTR